MLFSGAKRPAHILYTSMLYCRCWRVKAVEAKVSNRTLKKYVPVFEERRVDRDLLVEGARNLRDYFQ